MHINTQHTYTHAHTRAQFSQWRLKAEGVNSPLTEEGTEAQKWHMTHSGLGRLGWPKGPGLWDTQLPAWALFLEARSGLGCAMTPSLWASGARVPELLPDLPPVACSREDRLQQGSEHWTSVP